MAAIPSTGFLSPSPPKRFSCEIDFKREACEKEPHLVCCLLVFWLGQSYVSEAPRAFLRVIRQWKKTAVLKIVKFLIFILSWLYTLAWQTFDPAASSILTSLAIEAILNIYVEGSPPEHSNRVKTIKQVQDYPDKARGQFSGLGVGILASLSGRGRVPSSSHKPPKSFAFSALLKPPALFDDGFVYNVFLKAFLFFPP